MNSFALLALLLTIPVGLVTTYLVRYFVGPQCNTLKLVACGFLTTIFLALIVAISTSLSIHSQTSDTEIISGQITGKKREHGSYIRSYQCNCTRDSKGNTTCSTCHESRYTVTWNAFSTVGTFQIDHVDTDSRLVYTRPDPQRFTSIKDGDPAAVSRFYRNYKLGLPDEYSHNKNLGASPELLGSIPEYPTIFDFYHVTRVINTHSVIPATTAARINSLLADKLKTFGHQKEVNVIMVFGKPDPNLQYAVREKWNGGKKNDVIIVMGVENQQLTDVAVLTWDKNEYFKIKLQDTLLNHATIDAELVEKTFAEIKEHFKRPQMKEYEHLRLYIQPSTWVLVMNFMFLLIFPAIIVLFFKSKPRNMY